MPAWHTPVNHECAGMSTRNSKFYLADNESANTNDRRRFRAAFLFYPPLAHQLTTTLASG